MQKKQSKIINVFFESQITNKKLPNLELHDLKNIFKVFGKIKTIIIYDRKKMIKSFIQFQSIKSIDLLTKIINGNKINSFGECRVTISKKEILESNRFIEFIDYTTNEFNLTDSLKIKAFEFESSKKSTEVDERVCFKGDFRIVKELMGILRKNRDCRFGFGKGENEKNVWNFKINDHIKKLAVKNDAKKTVKKIFLKNLKSLKTSKEKSKILLVSNLQDFSSVHEIHNLFSSFGNINKILFMKNNHNALIEYNSPASAETCFSLMNQQKIKKSKITISFSKKKIINLNQSIKSPNAKFFNQDLKVPNEIHRFINNKIFIYSPSKKILGIIKKSYKISSKFLKDFLDKVLESKEFIVLESDWDYFKIGLVYGSVGQGLYVMAKCGIVVRKEFKMVLGFN